MKYEGKEKKTIAAHDTGNDTKNQSISQSLFANAI